MATLIDKMHSCGFFDPATVSILRYLNPNISVFSDPQDIPWLDLVAFLVFRQGHTALSFEEHFLETFFKNASYNSPEKFSEEELSAITGYIQKHIHEKAWNKWPEPYFFYPDTKKISLPFTHTHDRRLVDELYRLSTSTPNNICTSSSIYKIEGAYKILEKGTEEQAKAILNSIENPFSIIYGGPGTGKTYTAGALISLLIKKFHSEKRTFSHPYRVLTTAPTGKAVFTLKASIQKYFNNICADLHLEKEMLHIEAMTIHAFLLEQKRSGRDIGYHTIIIDESSMIDTKLMSALLSEIHSGTRVVMMGDSYQLPPIDPGQPFADLIHVAKILKQSYFAVSELTKCLRTELQGIVSLAQAVLQGDREVFFSQFEKEQEEIKFLPITESTQKQDLPLQKVYSHIAGLWEKELSIEEAFSLSNQIKILSPIRQYGIMSAQSTNKTIMQNIKTKKKRFLKPILITKNKYDLQCMNGDIGILESYTGKNIQTRTSRLHIPSSSLSPFPTALCSDYEPAYAMTIHKSQGSEFGTVIATIPHDTRTLSREMLYTAITRAKKEVILIGSLKAIEEALTLKTNRISCLPEMIINRFTDPQKIQGS